MVASDAKLIIILQHGRANGSGVNANAEILRRVNQIWLI
jgi:hypothetical protein